jgi:hypothetical protein
MGVIKSVDAGFTINEEHTVSILRFALSSLLVTLITLTSGCIVERDRGDHEAYQEGYYDHEHHRWWHEHKWHECIEHDEHCH